MTSNPKRKALSLKEKLDIIEDIDNGKSRKLIADQFSVAASTISSIYQTKEKLFESLKTNPDLNTRRVKAGPFDAINFQLLSFVNDMKSNNFSISGPLLMNKAKQIAEALKIPNFAASNGWLSNFKKRNNISFKDSPKEFEEATEGQASDWTNLIPSLVNGFNAADIYCVDETALFFRCLPDNSFHTVKNDAQNGNYPKDKLTIALGSNLTGEDKLNILIIGKSKGPKWLEGVKDMPLTYKFNAMAWIDTIAFKSWIHDLDARMTKEKRKILLFIRSTNSHSRTSPLNFKSIKIYFFPYYFNSELQPFGSGIFERLKYHYRKEMVNDFVKALDVNEPYEPPMLKESVRILSRLWEQKIKPAAIENCFKKAGFDMPSNPCPTDIEKGQPKEDLDLSQIFPDSSPPLSPTLSPSDFPPPLNWTKVLETNSVDITFSDYVNIDKDVPVSEDMTAEILMKQVYPTADEPLNESQGDLNPHNASNDGPPAFMPDDQALASLFDTLSRKKNVPQQAFKALSYIDGVLSNID